MPVRHGLADPGLPTCHRHESPADGIARLPFSASSFFFPFPRPDTPAQASPGALPRWPAHAWLLCSLTAQAQTAPSAEVATRQARGHARPDGPGGQSDLAQAASPVAAAAVGSSERVVVTGRAVPLPAGVAGFGDVPLYTRHPSQATVTLSSSQLQSMPGVDSIWPSMTRLDASVSDAYNSPGLLGPSDPRARLHAWTPASTCRRDGLPLNAAKPP